MNTPARLGTYAAALAVAFAGAFGVGNAVGPLGPTSATQDQHGNQQDEHGDQHGSTTPEGQPVSPSKSGSSR